MFFIAWNSLRVDCYSSSAMERRGGERRAIVSQFLTRCHSSSCDGSVCQRVFEFWISQLVKKGKIKVQFPRLSELPIRHYPPATNTLLRLSFTRFFNIYIYKQERKETHCESYSRTRNKKEKCCVSLMVHVRFWWGCMRVHGLRAAGSGVAIWVWAWQSAKAYLTHKTSWKITHGEKRWVTHKMATGV